ncbi:MAG: hypothetical protein V4592_03385 [Bacteroidota bacterium]
MKKIINLAVIIGSLFLLSACHQKEIVNISKPTVEAGAAITSDTLKGSVKGTMVSGKTYYFKSDVTVNNGDTLLMQSGVKLIAIGDGTSAAKSPQLTIYGTFISLGTQTDPNWITVPDAQRIQANAFAGLWGGIVCAPAPAPDPNQANPYKGGDLILKWTHIEFAGGPSGIGNPPYAQGDPRYLILFANLNKNFIMEDCWIYGSKDDAIRTTGGNISIMRNTFESCGQAGGEFFNMKSGTVGDLAYNMLIGAATNSLKAANTSTTTIQCNVNMYNNTMVNGGWRQTKTGRGGSIDYEQGARGLCYNNLMVNCRFGLRVTTDADLPNIAYNNNYDYGNSANIVAQFIATDGVASFKANDIHGTAKQNNPMFYGFDVDKFDYSTQTGAVSYTAQALYLLTIGTSNFRLQAGSPAIGKGKTDFAPLKAVTATGTLGANVMLPGKDIGAYQSDGTGNQH